MSWTVTQNNKPQKGRQFKRWKTNRSVAMKFSFFINLFLAQCLSVYALDQNIPVSDEYQRRVQEASSGISVNVPVSYDCRFINRWTSFRHPNHFPTSTAFWSRPLMASHNNKYTMWSGDQVPSAGVQVIAEVCHIKNVHFYLGHNTKTSERRLFIKLLQYHVLLCILYFFLTI